MIHSLLENDMYKFSMGQCIYNNFPSYTTTWRFKFRNWEKLGKVTPIMLREIQDRVNDYCSLRFSEPDLAYLRSIPWMKPAYVDFLRLWHPSSDEIEITDNDPSGLSITVKGSWLNTSMYEVPILAIVSEVYCKHRDPACNCITGSALEDVVNQLSSSNIKFSEFGLRRRYSGDAQTYMVSKLKETPGFLGTSNVYLARLYGIKPMGTMAHEFIMCAGQGDPSWNPAYSNKAMMEAWTKEYGVDNGIALTDTIGTDMFLKDFDKKFATLFSGVRHDSGNPIEWGNKMIEHYESLGIDPTTKTLLFSDSLTAESAALIAQTFEGRAKTAFGIGTFISNPSPIKLNIVMKVVECNGLPVAKLSDVPGKGMCEDQEYIKYLNDAIEWRKKKGK